MEGSVSIYVNRKDKFLSRGLYYTVPAGFGQTMGGYIPVERDALKECVMEGLAESLAAYRTERQASEPWRITKYKTWNKWHRFHQCIKINYDADEKKYRIALLGRDERAHSYVEPEPGCDFLLAEEEFETRFEEIMDFLIDKVRIIHYMILPR